MKSTFSAPVDLCYINGEFVVLDSGNDLIRTVSPKNGKTGTVALSGVGAVRDYEQAVTDGQRVYLPAVKLKHGDATVSFRVDLGEEYEIVSWGRNEVALDDPKAFNEVTIDNMSSGSAEIYVSGDPDNVNVQFELYVTYRRVDKPEALCYQSALVLIPIEREGESSRAEAPYELPKDFVR